MPTLILIIIGALFIIAIWALPIIIACVRKHPNKTGIILLDIFLGLTFIGWVVALIWSVSNPNKQTNIYYNMPGYYPQGQPMNGQQGQFGNYPQGQPANGQQGQFMNYPQGQPINGQQGQTNNSQSSNR